MWTRGRLDSPYHPEGVRPWHMPVQRGERGKLTGTYPGYGAGLIRGGHTPLEPGLARSGAVAPGFGIAMDPSDPATWRKPVQFT
jgi:hypothetical protein